MIRKKPYLFIILFFISANIIAQTKQQIPELNNANKTKVDRLAILNNELKESVENLAKIIEKEPNNEEKKHRIREDIKVLNSEIGRIKREKIVEVEWKQKEVKNVVTVSQEAGEKVQEQNIKFESWDVFKNFGKKEN